MKILILGSSGMLGNALLRSFAADPKFKTFGSVRFEKSIFLFPEFIRKNIITGIDVENIELLKSKIKYISPNLVINCVGLVKQLNLESIYSKTIYINSFFPHKLLEICKEVDARLIHMSTDCVFSGKGGDYLESDFPDSRDLYGLSKLLGEINAINCITLRTSIIGHELAGGNRSLINWFLSQDNSVPGYTRAIFSGLPTIEISRVIRDFVIPNVDLHGLFHLSSNPISKFDLLNLVAKEYDKKINIYPEESFSLNRSLDSSRFRSLTGYIPKTWENLVHDMNKFR